MMMDNRKLAPERLGEIREALLPAGGDLVDELFGHIAAMDDEHTVINQYYEEFLIPEILRGGPATAEEQQLQLEESGRATAPGESPLPPSDRLDSSPESAGDPS